MAKIGDTPAANRYEGISTGQRLEHTFETQPGVPVDGTNEMLRRMSPFVLRLIPPDALLAAAAAVAEEPVESVDLITAAAQGANQSGLAKEIGRYLSAVSPIDGGETRLSTFVSGGRFFQGIPEYHATIADAAAAVDVALQLRKILEAPPLTLLVNPSSMDISYTNIQTYATRTRHGFEFERWGEEQPTISFSGSTGAFIAGAAVAPGTDVFTALSNGTVPTVSGVQYASKRDSAAWQNLTSLFQFYKSNGYIYDTIGHSEAHLFIGAVAIDYDQWTYVGHIESFEYSYDETKPHNVDWSIQFTVDRMFDLAPSTVAVQPLRSPTPSPSDPKYANSGGRTVPVNTWGADIAGQFKGFGGGLAEATAEVATFGTVPFDLLE